MMGAGCGVWEDRKRPLKLRYAECRSAGARKAEAPAEPQTREYPPIRFGRSLTLPLNPES